MWRLILSVLAVAGSLYFAITKSPTLGLDLKGGTQVVLQLQSRTGGSVTSDQATQTLEILRRRVDSLGATEPNLEVASGNRINVELPGISNPDQAVATIGKTAVLTFHPVEAQVQPNTSTTVPGAATAPAAATQTTAALAPSTTAAGLGTTNTSALLGQAAVVTTTSAVAQPTTTTAAGTATTQSTVAATTATTTPVNETGSFVAQDSAGGYYQLGASTIDGNGVGDASAALDPQSGQWYITVNFKGAGSAAWTKLTGAAACNTDGDVKRQVAIVLDGTIISHPQVDPSIGCNVGITGGSTQITGSFTQSDAQNLALLIKGGALPVNVSVASQSVIGPELGDQAITDSRNAVIIGGILTLLFILIYYRFLGLFAMVALAAYGLISYGIIDALGLTLTLPGIAGFVLAIGMAMDSNVLVYERVKEELAGGRQMRQAARLGFKNALSAILDSNSTTLLAALTLYFLAVGEVKGFGLTLAVGTVASIFTTLVILRLLVEGVLARKWAANHPTALGMNVGSRFRKRMADNPPRLMHFARYTLIISAVLVIGSIVGLGTKGINYGIEFKGGRYLEYSTQTTVNLDRAREKVDALGFDGAVVQRSGADDTSVRVPALTRDQETSVTNIMKELGGGTATVLRDETTGPSFGAELKRKALIGLIIGVLIQLALVAFRYRWTFGLGAVAGMLHDALIVLGVFVWLQRPFDSVFLAALLTIISYSVNDSVVVFDRIREQRRRRAGEGFATVVNDACAQTLPRTVNISLCIMFILGSLLFLGGQTLGDFALALILGIVLGVYSSVFVASPITVALERWKPAIAGSRTRTTSASTKKKAVAVTADPSGDETAAVPANRPAPRPRKKSKSSKKRR